MIARIKGTDKLRIICTQCGASDDREGRMADIYNAWARDGWEFLTRPQYGDEKCPECVQRTQEAVPDA